MSYTKTTHLFGPVFIRGTCETHQSVGPEHIEYEEEVLELTLIIEQAGGADIELPVDSDCDSAVYNALCDIIERIDGPDEANAGEGSK